MTAGIIGLVVIFGLIALVLWLRDSNTKITIEKDIAENEADILEKQRDASVNNPDDALRVFKQIRDSKKLP